MPEVIKCLITQKIVEAPVIGSDGKVSYRTYADVEDIETGNFNCDLYCCYDQENDRYYFSLEARSKSFSFPAGNKILDRSKRLHDEVKKLFESYSSTSIKKVAEVLQNEYIRINQEINSGVKKDFKENSKFDTKKPSYIILGKESKQHIEFSSSANSDDKKRSILWKITGGQEKKKNPNKWFGKKEVRADAIPHIEVLSQEDMISMNFFGKRDIILSNDKIYVKSPYRPEKLYSEEYIKILGKDISKILNKAEHEGKIDIKRDFAIRLQAKKDFKGIEGKRRFFGDLIKKEEINEESSGKGINYYSFPPNQNYCFRLNGDLYYRANPSDKLEKISFEDTKNDPVKYDRYSQGYSYLIEALYEASKNNIDKVKDSETGNYSVLSAVRGMFRLFKKSKDYTDEEVYEDNKEIIDRWNEYRKMIDNITFEGHELDKTNKRVGDSFNAFNYNQVNSSQTKENANNQTPRYGSPSSSPKYREETFIDANLDNNYRNYRNRYSKVISNEITNRRTKYSVEDFVEVIIATAKELELEEETTLRFVDIVNEMGTGKLSFDKRTQSEGLRKLGVSSEELPGIREFSALFQEKCYDKDIFDIKSDEVGFRLGHLSKVFKLEQFEDLKKTVSDEFGEEKGGGFAERVRRSKDSNFDRSL